MESVDNHKNLEIELLQKDKEQLNSQYFNINIKIFESNIEYFFIRIFTNEYRIEYRISILIFERISNYSNTFRIFKKFNF
jgi:hypothetical protein